MQITLETSRFSNRTDALASYVFERPTPFRAHRGNWIRPPLAAAQARKERRIDRQTLEFT